MSTWPILAVHRRRRTDNRISNSELKRQHMCASRERVPRRLRVVLLAPPFSRRRRTNVLLQYNFGLRHAHRSETAISATKFILIDKKCQNGGLLVCMSTVSTGLWHDDDVVGLQCRLVRVRGITGASLLQQQIQTASRSEAEEPIASLLSTHLVPYSCTATIDQTEHCYSSVSRTKVTPSGPKEPASSGADAD